jgi:flagellar basal body P-ring formation protein FlgA
MKSKNLLTLSRFAALALLLQTSIAAAQEKELTVTILSDAVVDDTIVTLDQIAKLSGGSPELRKRLGKLDVTDFPLSAGHRVVGSEQVRFRLFLADMVASEFRISGAKRTTIVEPEDPISLRKVLAAGEQALRARYPGNAGNASFTANKSITIPTLEVRPGDRVRLDAVVSGPVPLNGRVHVEVSLMVNGKKREFVPVFFDVVQRRVGPEQPIRPAANWTPAAGTEEFLIKARDNVKIVAVLGAARIEAVGEAQQDGKVGQIIRVRNVESNRIVHGRVEASGIVTVEY